MLSASLFLVQCLVVTSASECADPADQTCVGIDSASLLQNTVQLQGVVSASQEAAVESLEASSFSLSLSPTEQAREDGNSTLEESGSTRASLNQRDEVLCGALTGPEATDESLCDAYGGGGVCNWNPEDGGSCAAGCATKDIGKKATSTAARTAAEADCPAYCLLIKSQTRCLATTNMQFGGTRGAARGYSRSKDENGKSMGFKAVPQYLTTSRCVSNCSSTGVWDTCDDGKQNGDCFYGYGTSGSKINAYLTGAYASIAAEVAIKCEGAGDLEVKVENANNAKINMFYNDTEVCGDSTSACEVNHILKLEISSKDSVPIFRVELSSSGSDTSAKVKIVATHIKATFDNCMGLKEGHAQCLEVFAGSGKQSELRSNHQLQAQCICSGTDTLPGGLLRETYCQANPAWDFRADGNSDIAGCAGTDPTRSWLACLGDDAKTIILKAVRATSLLESTSTALLAQDLTKTSLKCTPAGHGTCVDPANLDIEAFDCNCFDWMSASSPETIRTNFCCDDHVCCDWKTEDRCPATLVCPTLLVEVNESSMMQLSQAEKTSEHDTSLDESLSGKRCSD